MLSLHHYYPRICFVQAEYVCMHFAYFIKKNLSINKLAASFRFFFSLTISCLFSSSSSFLNNKNPIFLKTGPRLWWLYGTEKELCIQYTCLHTEIAPFSIKHVFVWSLLKFNRDTNYISSTLHYTLMYIYMQACSRWLASVDISHFDYLLPTRLGFRITFIHIYVYWSKVLCTAETRKTKRKIDFVTSNWFWYIQIFSFSLFFVDFKVLACIYVRLEFKKVSIISITPSIFACVWFGYVCLQKFSVVHLTSLKVNIWQPVLP